MQQYYNEIVSISQRIYDSSRATKDEITLLENYPHIFVLSCVMDRQSKYIKTSEIPFQIADKLGGLNFKLFSDKSEKWYIDFFKEKKLHRFPHKMAVSFYKAIQKIKNDYNGNAGLIWNDNPTSAELVYRFLEFDGVGIKIATMATNILSRDYGVKIKDHYAIDISPDIHVKRTMYRLGLLPEQENIDFSQIDSTKVIYKAKSINPTFPGLMDLAFWEIGTKKICTNKKCNSKNCPFGDICKKQGI